MKVLVVNCGSSSIKYQLINMENEEVMAKGYLEKIGLPDSFLTHTVNGEKHRIEKVITNHEDGIKLVLDQLLDANYGVIKDLKEIDAIGHRVVHGGEKFSDSVIITDEVIDTMKECIPLAPLHNPAGITGIEACRKVLPEVPMVGVFDTAFHQTLPEEAYIYAIPYEYYEKYRIRKYGFHGTSHKFVSRRVAELMGKPLEDLKMVTCHLGQGGSLCAVKGGKSVDTSMGLTPLAGIPMGTRSGDIDPSIVTFLMKQENLTPDEMDTILNKKSGKLGVSGVSFDDRDIEAAAKEGNERAKLAIDTFVYQVIGYIGRDIEDAIILGKIKREDIPKEITDILGSTNREIMNTIILDIINNSLDKPYIKMSEEVYKALFMLKDFNYNHIYKYSLTKDEYDRYSRGMKDIYHRYLLDIENDNIDSLIYKDFLAHQSPNYLTNTSNKQKVIDFIAGMTDDYFVEQIS